MCFSGTCPYELWSGDCGKRKHQRCPDDYETMEEFYEAMTNLEDERAEHLYEQQRERMYERRQ